MNPTPQTPPSNTVALLPLKDQMLLPNAPLSVVNKIIGSSSKFLTCI